MKTNHDEQQQQVDCDLQDMFGSSDDDSENKPESSLQHEDHVDRDLLDMFGSSPCQHLEEEEELQRQEHVNGSSSSRLVETKESIQRKRVAKAILIQSQKKKKSNQQQVASSSLPDKKAAPKKTTFFRLVEMNHYWKNLLEWDFMHDLNESQQQQGVAMNNANPQKMEDPLPDTFGSCQEYKARWSPLLLQEVRSQILSEVSSELVPIWARGGGLESVLVEPSSINNNNEQTLLIRSKQQQGSGESFQAFVNNVFLLVQDAQSLVEAAQGKLFLGNSMQKKKRLGILGLAMNHTKTLDGLRIKVSFKKWQEVGKLDMFVARIGSNVTCK